MEPLSNLILCPHCHQTFDDTNLEKTDCCFGRPIKISNSIIDFSKTDFYWNHISKEDMEILCRDAEELGWQNSLTENFLPKVGNATYQYAVDERRADWAPLCSINTNSTIVDIGAGWGAISINLARKTNKVIAVDTSRQNLKFIDIRAYQEGLNNIDCILSDPLDLSSIPLKNGIADLVIFNGVLEWIGTADQVNDPQILQMFALDEAYRILKPGGQLYLAIESRYGHSYWRGKGDHPDTKFTSIMPRWCASIVTKSLGLGEYRTYTHSYSSLTSMLKKSNFTDTSFFVPFPDYRYPKKIIPLRTRKLFSDGVGRAGISRKHAFILKMFAAFRLYKTLVDDYIIIAKK